MIVHALLYHDVIDPGGSQSGFAGGDAEIYKIATDDFIQHMEAVDKASRGVIGVLTCRDEVHESGSRVLLTFDDGGVSAYDRVAELLESKGWRGHFFVTTSRIGTKGFLSGRQVRQLAEAGHVIGSHSHTHPPRMSACGDSELAEEWLRSRSILEDLTGAPVHTASVPGGYYSPRVAIEASGAGIEILFTSEPRSRPWMHAGCILIGRYAVMQRSSSTLAGALAGGSHVPRLRQRVLWEGKKVVKHLIGDKWLALRRALYRSH